MNAPLFKVSVWILVAIIIQVQGRPMEKSLEAMSKLTLDEPTSLKAPSQSIRAFATLRTRPPMASNPSQSSRTPTSFDFSQIESSSVFQSLSSPTPGIPRRLNKISTPTLTIQEDSVHEVSPATKPRKIERRFPRSNVNLHSSSSSSSLHSPSKVAFTSPSIPSFPHSSATPLPHSKKPFISTTDERECSARPSSSSQRRFHLYKINENSVKSSSACRPPLPKTLNAAKGSPLYSKSSSMHDPSIIKHPIPQASHSKNTLPSESEIDEFDVDDEMIVHPVKESKV